MKALPLFLLLGLGIGVSPRLGAQSASPPVEETAAWAILADGRLKPLDSFARESVRAVSGRTTLDGLHPLELIWGYHFATSDFIGRDYIRLDNPDLKRALGFPVEQRRFSFLALRGNPAFQRIATAALRKREAEEGLSPVEADAAKVYDKLERVASWVEGTALTIVPVLRENGAWSTPDMLREDPDPKHQAIYQGFSRLAAAYAHGDGIAFGREAQALSIALRAVNPEAYPTSGILARELFLNRFQPYQKAWLFDLAAFLLLVYAVGSRKRMGHRLGILALLLGLAFHTLGFGLRWSVAGHAPVSDMYESLVFMAWGVVAIGLVLELFSGKSWFGIAASATGFLALLFAQNLPLDSSINPLVPVLANTSWLSIHVMTIMLSYSAFALAMAMGHLLLFLQIARPGKTHQLRSISGLLYKTLQVGVLFLCAGIAFGAIWANESWGRYWGWDPKETWSLITMFVYMVLVHARFAGWLSNFGLAISSIVSFLAVIMTYYGVNFVLGTGLHSYGFAEGGLPWVMLYLGVESLILLLGSWRYLGKTRSRKGVSSRGCVPTAS